MHHLIVPEPCLQQVSPTGHRLPGAETDPQETEECATSAWPLGTPLALPLFHHSGPGFALHIWEDQTTMVPRAS